MENCEELSMQLGLVCLKLEWVFIELHIIYWNCPIFEEFFLNYKNEFNPCIGWLNSMMGFAFS